MERKALAAARLRTAMCSQGSAPLASSMQTQPSAHTSLALEAAAPWNSLRAQRQVSACSRQTVRRDPTAAGLFARHPSSRAQAMADCPTGAPPSPLARASTAQRRRRHRRSLWRHPSRRGPGYAAPARRGLRAHFREPELGQLGLLLPVQQHVRALRRRAAAAAQSAGGWPRRPGTAGRAASIQPEPAPASVSSVQHNASRTVAHTHRRGSAKRVCGGTLPRMRARARLP